MKPAWLLCLALPAFAQAPDEAALRQDPRGAMIAAAQKAYELKPRNGRVLAELGRAYLIAGNRPKAEAAFAQIDKQWLTSAETCRLIAAAWLDIGVRDPVRDLAKQALALGSRDKNELTQFAVLLMDAGFAKEAEDQFTPAFERDPRDWQNVTAFGRACLRQKRQDLAAKWWAKGMEEQPKEPQFWNEIAMALIDGGAER